MLAPHLPDSAPFTPDQRAWLNGFFAGWAANGRNGAFNDANPAPSYPAFSGDGALSSAEPEVALEVTPTAPAYSAAEPFHTRLITNRRLSAEGSAKDVRHLEIDLRGSGVTYEVGDALGVVPHNCPTYAGELISALGWTGDEAVEVGGADVSVREALERKLTITAPSRALLEAYGARDTDLAVLLEAGQKQALADFLWGRDVLDLVEAYPSVGFEPQTFVNLLRPLAHRLYSISSSLKAHPGQVHLTVGAVRYAARGRARTGVCSAFLADRCTTEGPLPVFVHRNPNFGLPADPATPIIMVGPGTGIAPFRAFLEERRATGARGATWLFFGDQHAATDFLYRDELDRFQRDGTLTRLNLAWSRDGTEKVYVQHRMLAEAEALYAWLEDGAAFYVCGDASRMAKDVDAALHAVVRQVGGKSEEEAAAYVKALKKSKRYLRDVY